MCLRSLLLLLASALPLPAATVWTSADSRVSTITFAKPPFVDHQDPRYQNHVSRSVIIAREDDHGIFNALAPTGPQLRRGGDATVTGTRWAFAGRRGNPIGSAFDARHFENLNFTSWGLAHGASPVSVIGLPAVLHLVEENIYLDLRMTHWGRGDGAFSYERADGGEVIPEPDTALLAAIGGFGLLWLAQRRRR